MSAPKPPGGLHGVEVKVEQPPAHGHGHDMQHLQSIGDGRGGGDGGGERMTPPPQADESGGHAFDHAYSAESDLVGAVLPSSIFCVCLRASTAA